MGTVRTSSLKMKLLIVLGCLMALASGHQKLVKSEQCGSDETSCPAGCCPEANWYCCPDNMYCAATAADCPFVAMSEKLTKMAANKQCGSDETSCPAGCCPEANWYCCPDNMYCAATAADCPFVAMKEKLPRWLLTSNVDLMRPHAQLDVAQRLTGTAAQTTCTVLPLLLTVLLLPLVRSSPRWLPISNVDLTRPHAQLDVAQRLTGIAAQTTCTVLPLLLTVLLLP